MDFRDGILFVPEVLLSANAMKAGMAILRPLLAETGAPKIGKMVIGTVKGDIHDIGKNLVSMMMEGAGFEVIDLGINNPVEKYLEAIEEHQPDILGMSALLTTTMPYMKVVIDTLKEKGMRDDYVVLVGGAPLNEEFAKAIGADAYCRDAAVAVETAKSFMARRQGSTRRHGALNWIGRTGAPGMTAQPRTLRDRLRRAGARARRGHRGEPLGGLDVTCLPAILHNRPQQIPDGGAAEDPRQPRPVTTRSSASTAIAARAAMLDRGAGGRRRRAHRGRPLLRVLRRHARPSTALVDEEPGTFFLTDYLVRHFDRLIIKGLGLDRYPELLHDYFGNYTRVVYLAQFDDPAMTAKAQLAADRLGLAFERRFTGLGAIERFVTPIQPIQPGA